MSSRIWLYCEKKKRDRELHPLAACFPRAPSQYGEALELGERFPKGAAFLVML